MNAAFFGLAFLAALNPKLLAVDLLLVDNQRPRMLLAAGRLRRRRPAHISAS